MKQIKCPVCEKRLLDSNISLQVAKLTSVNMKDADMVIKCKVCKSCIAVNTEE